MVDFLTIFFNFYCNAARTRTNLTHHLEDITIRSRFNAIRAQRSPAHVIFFDFMTKNRWFIADFGCFWAICGLFLTENWLLDHEHRKLLKLSTKKVSFFHERNIQIDRGWFITARNSTSHTFGIQNRPKIPSFSAVYPFRRDNGQISHCVPPCVSQKARKGRRRRPLPAALSVSGL